MEILDRIKKLCNIRDISVGDLEKELELSNGSIYKWNKTIPGADKVEKVADYFKVSVDYLLGKTAFKNGFELFEHWGYSADGFESAFDFGELLKIEREKKGVLQEEVSQALDLTVSDVNNIEDGILPLNYDWAEKYAKFLGTSVNQIFFDNGMYDEQIPSQFDGNVEAYENLKKAEREDALNENLNSKIRTSSSRNNEEKGLTTEDPIENLPQNIRAAARNLMDLDEDGQRTAIDMINYLSQKGKKAKEE